MPPARAGACARLATIGAMPDPLRSSGPARLGSALVLAAALGGACSTAPTRPAAPDAAPAPPTAVPPAPPQAAAAEPAEPPLEQRFAAWVQAFRASARAAGIDDATLDAAFAGVQHVPRAVERDRAQPEFTRNVWDYLDSAASPQRIARGRERLAQVRAEADAAAARHGVPAPVLAAIWGVESDYGRYTGDIPTIDALATLGFDGRREAWARAELIAALKILQRGDADRMQLVGSWAGAMGQTQFLPSVYLAHAVDADGDGRRDIWTSAADVLASTANFLARSGWRSDEPWGAEVRLPTGFDLGRADGVQRQPAAQWAAEGVQGVGGEPLPPIADAAILLPAGARGPAFLVGANFRTLLRYNNSTSYALAVALLAQQIDGGAGVVAAWPRELAALSRSQVLMLQTALNALGFDSGTPDGVAGPATREALRRWQRSVGLPADGYPTVDQLDRLTATR